MASRYFVDELPELSAPRVPPATQHHLRSVMRVRVGDEIRLFDGCGGEALVRIRALGRRDLDLEVLEISRRERPATRHVEICFSPPTESRLAQILEHGCELGVACFRPLRFERSKPLSREKSRPERWLRILTAAAGQSGVAWLPQMHPVDEFEAYLETTPTRLRFVAEHADAWQGPFARPADLQSPHPATVFIGPEGGFSSRERKLLEDAGCSAISIGPHVLRVETAALATATMLIARAASKGPETRDS